MLLNYTGNLDLMAFTPKYRQNPRMFQAKMVINPSPGKLYI
jgi:hypothetical protein